MDESLDSKQLKAFSVLAETGSYTETAKRLHVTHSAICHTLRALEEKAGCRLFAKAGKKLVPTEAGEALLYYTLRALNELDAARRSLTYLNNWGTRRLRVAADALFLSIFLSPVLLKFYKEHPNVLVQIESSNATEAYRRLENNQVDVLLTEKPSNSELFDFFPLLTDRFLLVVKVGHPLVTGRAVPREDFGKYPCFLVKDSAQRRRQVEEFMQRQKISLSVLGEIEDLAVVKELVKGTLALAFLPRWSVNQELEERSLVSLPYGRSYYERTWGLVCSRGRPLNMTESTLLKLCRRRIGDAELKTRDTVKVGVLHSLSGTMAISETSLRDVLLFAFDEINRSGGVRLNGKAHTIEPVVVDGASNWPMFAQKARELLVEDQVAVTFGCWTSVSRKLVQPIFERENGLLFYPVQYEGEELSKNIFYLSETVNQQAIPAIDYLLAQGRRKFYLIGTDYVYPQTTNLILYKYLLMRGIPPENIGGGLRRNDAGGVTAAGKYVPFGHTDFQAIAGEIKQFAASGEACVINTINGDSNVAFFRKIVAAGLSSADCPIVSFSLAEDELRSMPTRKLVGEIGCWSYFMSIKTRENRTFLKNWRNWLNKETYPGIIKKHRAVDSPIVLSYSGVYLWKAAVEKAGTFEVDAVRKVLESGTIHFNGPGGRITVQGNHHCTKDMYIGKTKANGQFTILETFPQVVADPFVTESFHC